MYCKYCGKPIDNDSIYCRYCGRQIGEVENTDKSLSTHSSLIRNNSESYSFSRIRITKEQIFRILRLNLIWKVIKTIVLSIVGLFVFLFVGLLISPLIALFNAEIPSFGFIDEIEKIWKKEKDNEDKTSE